MKNLKELIELIEKEISTIDEQISTISVDLNGEMIESRKLIERNSSLETLDFLKELSLESLDLPESFKDDLTNLSFYINILNTSYADTLKNQEGVLTQLKEILARIHDYILKIEQTQKENQKSLSTLNTSKEKLIKLKEKLLSNNYDCDEEEIELVYNILMKSENKRKAIDIMISFGEATIEYENKSIKTEDERAQEEIEEEEIIENENTDKVKEELKALFADFDLDFDKFYEQLDDKEKEELLTQAKINRIEEILNILKKYNISLNDSYYGSRLLIKKASQIKSVLLYSNHLVIEKILENAENKKIYFDEITDKDGNVRKGIDFDKILELPARLIPKKRRFKRRGTQLIDANFGKDYYGAANDYILNQKLFESLGVSPQKFLNSGYTTIVPYEKTESIIKLFKLYGIDKEMFIKTLSCFVSTHPADALDQFIELGQFDYVINNMSRCRLLADDPIFYRLLYGIKHTKIPMSDIISPSKKLSALIHGKASTDGAIPSFEITRNNKHQKVNQTATFYGDKEVYDACNELVDPLSSDVTLAISRTDSIIHILDEHFLVKDENNKMKYPNIYNFGFVDTKRGQFAINISRNKVLRICNELMKHNIEIDNIDTIMYILTKNSILTEQEYYMIYNQVQKVIKRGVER